MSAIIKNKNIIEFQLNDTQTYRYDMNSGILYGLKQTPLKSIPTMVNALLESKEKTSNLIYYLSHGYGEGERKERFANVKMVSFFDRLDTAGFPVLTCLSPYYIPILEKHFKKIRKEFVEEEKPIHFFLNRLQEYDFSDWLEENGLKLDDHFTRDKAMFLKTNCFPKKWNSRFAYYLCRDGLWDFFAAPDEYGCRRGLLVLEERFTSFILMMETMGRTPEKGNFIRQYSEIQAEYNLRKREFDNILLHKNQSAHTNALNFSYHNFEVVIPTTSEEFVNEGNSQSNCVARVYLPKVLRGETNVVFVRKKDALNTSYITCEVRDGEIRQFLLQYNRRIDSHSPEEEFYNAYAKHLAQNWGE